MRAETDMPLGLTVSARVQRVLARLRSAPGATGGGGDRNFS